ncbi:MAG: aldo/keto reductase [Pseudomonadota bacterium]
MSINRKRRRLLSAAALILAAGGASVMWRGFMGRTNDNSGLPQGVPEIARTSGSMPYRRFGATGLQVSEIGFGAWGIGGNSYGPVERQTSLATLALAEELGCNFVDTAQVYGDSEGVLGEFLNGRRSRWIVATKYSGQPAGMTATLEEQLRRLGTDAVDYYQIHWAPGPDEHDLYAELDRLKQAGKARFVGVSLKSANDIDYVIDNTAIDGVMVPFSLLDPDPFLMRMQRLRESGLAVIARSVLKEGFLVGNLKRDAAFPDPTDQRHEWSRQRIERTVELVENFRFLENESGSMVAAAVHYPLSFPEVSTVLIGTTSPAHAQSNFGRIPGGRLGVVSLRQIAALQSDLGLRTPTSLVGRLLRRVRSD